MSDFLWIKMLLHYCKQNREMTKSKHTPNYIRQRRRIEIDNLLVFSFTGNWIHFIVLFFIPFTSASQSIFLPSGHHWHDFAERMEIKSGQSSTEFHGMLQPFKIESLVEFLQKSDSLKPTSTDEKVIDHILQSNIEYTGLEGDSSIIDLPLNIYATPTNFLQFESENHFISINPVLHTSLGIESGSDDVIYVNSRGLELSGIINQKVGFYSFITDNQARFPSWVNQKIDQQAGAIPGEGWNIPFGEGGYDFFTARGYIAFQATKNIGIQFGQDKNFQGFGKRSLILSDYGQNYLFLKINTKVGRFQYQNLFARLVDHPLRTYGSRRYDPKYMAAHTLSIKITPKFELGLFENVIFGRTDTIAPRTFDAHYLNPIIFYRAVEHHIGDPDKIALGTSWRWILPFNTALYGQIYIDDFHIGDIRKDIDSLFVRVGLRNERKYEEFASFRNKFGVQLGVKFIDFLTIKNLNVRFEANRVRPFTYAHYATDGSGLRPASSYSHYSQALAHPLGANFGEMILETQWQPHHNIILSNIFFWGKQGMDVNRENLGQNILNDYTTRQGDYGHIFLQGQLRYWLMANTRLSWQFRPNAWIDIIYTARNEQFDGDNTNTNTLSIGIRLNSVLRNHWF